jgi:Transposase DNA-binding/Transposase DDE domain
MRPRLNDARLERRFVGIVAAMTKAPDKSFPVALGDEAALEAAYRLLNNERVDWQMLLEPELATTARSLAARREPCLAVHDSTAFMLGGEADRDDIGSLDGRGPSYMGHFALAVAPTDNRQVLGLLGIEPIFRPFGPRKVKQTSQERFLDPAKESRRWSRMVDSVAALVERPAEIIHVMDAEGDSYELFAHLLDGKHRFVIRASANRLLATDEKLFTALDSATTVARREVPISGRARVACRGHNSHQARAARIAKLQVRVTSVELRRPRDHEHVPPSVRMNMVHVVELETPEGAQPVDWKLYTTEEIATPEQALAVVDYYRRRWVIEEYFKALKTGCAYEKRQLENRRALLNALAMLAPIACRLLELRHQGRAEAPVKPTALTSQQIQVLRSVLRKKLPDAPTAREVMLAVAGLGGHLKRNGDPGWQSLGHGLLKLLSYEVGWEAYARSDQS